MSHRKKLIEVALPLEAINAASSREKSIRHGHPSTLHLWWARRPLAAARAVIFTSLVDDPDSPDAPPAFVEACKQLEANQFGYDDAYAAENDTPRMRLFDFISHLVTWESTTDEKMLAKARELIQLSTDGNPPPLLDPFAGGGSIPLEAQRLGLEAHASDLNPVAVMINKAQIEIPPRFAGQAPVNPEDREDVFAPTSNSSPKMREEDNTWRGAAGLAADVRYYGEWMRERAWEKIGHLYPAYTPPSQTLPPQGGKGTPTPSPSPTKREGDMPEKWDISPELERRMQAVARDLRNNPTSAEDKLWQSLRKKQVDGRKFRRQVAIGAFVVDFYCPSERLVVEVDGPIHDTQQEADQIRQELIESLGIRFVRVTNNEVEHDIETAIEKIRAAFSPSLPVGEGAGGRGGETVIAWLWARTVKSPNPAVNAHVPLVRSFQLSKKKGRECWAKPMIEALTPSPSPTGGEGSYTHRVRFEVTEGKPPKDNKGTYSRSGGVCVISGVPIDRDYLYQEGQAGRIGAQLMAIVTEGAKGRSYYSPTEEHMEIARSAEPEWEPNGELPDNPRWFSPPGYGMETYASLFTPRQLTALTTFSDLVGAAREQAQADALAAGLPDDDVPLREGGSGARAYGEAVSVYLAFGVDRCTDYWSTIASWGYGFIRNTFSRQALPMVWDYVEGNPFSDSTGNWSGALDWIYRVLSDFTNVTVQGYAQQGDAASLAQNGTVALSTDPPYYDNIGYADLSDYFYVWMRKSLRSVYPDIFGTLLVPKQPELVASPYRFDGSKEQANRHFEAGLGHTFTNMRGFTHPSYPLSVYYAFKQQEIAITDNEVASTGWETMLTGLIESGFAINGTWPMSTERSGRTISSGTNALASSIILVCRPRPEDAPRISRREFVTLLRQELPAALEQMQSGNIAPVDLAQASIGPGMAVYSRYRAVVEADGTPLTVRTALQIINQELDAYLSEQEGHVDGDTRFAVAWFEQNGFGEAAFGTADVLARAKNTSVAGVEEAGVIESGRGKVRLLEVHDLYELNPDWDPNDDARATAWEAVHHLIARLERHGESGSAMLMLKMPSELAGQARALAYRLYSICERKGWAEYARGYNALVVQWSDIQGEVARQRQAVEDGTATQQDRLL